MKFIRESDLAEYADEFWKKQRTKDDPNDRSAIENLDKGGAPLPWLVNLYPYKLPNTSSQRIEVVEVSAAEEMDRFLIHHHNVADQWMVDRCLVPCPRSRRIGDLASLALKQHYFDISRSDTQFRLYSRWREKKSIDGIIEEHGRPLIERTWPNEYEIVDGWGRLMAISALIKSGLDFHPFQCFLATEK
jgi:hypothetical protein